jgi:hypothetical protein
MRSMKLYAADLHMSLAPDGRPVSDHFGLRVSLCDFVASGGGQPFLGKI